MRRADNRLYRIWKCAKERCRTPSCSNYERYGGAGVEMCSGWNRFEPFREWAEAAGYDDTLTLDRIDPRGNYEPDNCRWATVKEQANNRSNNRILTHAGKAQTIAEWADETGIQPDTIRKRLLHGWSTEKALTREVRKYDRKC